MQFAGSQRCPLASCFVGMGFHVFRCVSGRRATVLRRHTKSRANYSFLGLSLHCVPGNSSKSAADCNYNAVLAASRYAKSWLHYLCLDCQRWFCDDHGFTAVQVCLGCMDELYFVDRLGGAAPSVIDLKRLQALRRKQLAVPCNLDAVSSVAHKVWEVESRIRSRSPSRRSASFNRLCCRCQQHIPENAIDQNNYE